MSHAALHQLGAAGALLAAAAHNVFGKRSGINTNVRAFSSGTYGGVVSAATRNNFAYIVKN